jgi:hypothetical protein
MKLAVTNLASLITSVQVPTPVQGPSLQPVKVQPGEAAAFSSTEVLKAKEINSRGTP